MSRYNEREISRKPDDVLVGDDGADLAVLLIGARFGLKPHIARLVVAHAGLGGSGDRTAASGGRTK
jgi:hypothetical protein